MCRWSRTTTARASKASATCNTTLATAGGAKFLLLAALLYAPGTWLYAVARREQGLPKFGPRERWLFGLLCLAAMAALGALFTGALTI